MKRCCYIIALAFTVFLILTALPLTGNARPTDLTSPSADMRTVPPRGAERDAAFVPGRVLLRFRDEVHADAAQALLDRHSLTTIGRIEQIGVRILAVTKGQELVLVEQLRGNPQVAYAEPDYLRRHFRQRRAVARYRLHVHLSR